LDILFFGLFSFALITAMSVPIGKKQQKSGQTAYFYDQVRQSVTFQVRHPVTAGHFL
jgi:hypothetical protein